MENVSKIKLWLAQFRANFLPLAVVLTMIGIVFAFKYQGTTLNNINILNIALLIIGVVTSHISVNLFNEYSDYKTKIDFNTIRTPFSGGTGLMQQGLTKPESVRNAAYITLLLSVAVGLYFTLISHWFLIIFIVLGAFATFFYTNFLARYLLGEFFAGLTLGTFVILGSYIALTANSATSISNLIPLEVLILSIPPGILTAQLLLLNEFPDLEADKAGGRRQIVVVFGKNVAAKIYIAGHIVNYGIIILSPIFGISSYWIYIALMTIPFAYNASVAALKHHSNPNMLIPGMAKNVLVVLITDFLIFLSLLITRF